MENQKIVEFEKYCGKCVNKDSDENIEDSKCDVCLSNPVNYDSHKPVNFEEK